MSSYSPQVRDQLLKRLFLHDWRAKVASVIIAVAIWAVVKRQVTEITLPPGGAGGGTGYYKVRVIEMPQLLA